MISRSRLVRCGGTRSERPSVALDDGDQILERGFARHIGDRPGLRRRQYVAIVLSIPDAQAHDLGPWGDHGDPLDGRQAVGHGHVNQDEVGSELGERGE